MTATDIFDLAGLLSDFQYSFRLSRSTADYLTVMTIIILKVFTIFNEVSRPFGRLIYRFGCPNSGAQKTFVKFSFFGCISTKNS